MSSGYGSLQSCSEGAASQQLTAPSPHFRLFIFPSQQHEMAGMGNRPFAKAFRLGQKQDDLSSKRVCHVKEVPFRRDKMYYLGRRVS